MLALISWIDAVVSSVEAAGVVDSGGEGLLVFLEGVIACLKTKVDKPDNAPKPDMTGFDRNGYLSGISEKASKADKKAQDKEKKKQDKKRTEKKTTEKISEGIGKMIKKVSKADISTSDIRFRYCTEFIVLLETEFDSDREEEFKLFLEAIGDSIVVVADDEIVKVHVHTNMPGIAIQKGLTYGSLTSMKIDNMQEEHNERLALDEAAAAPAGYNTSAVQSASADNNDTAEQAGAASYGTADGQPVSEPSYEAAGDSYASEYGSGTDDNSDSVARRPVGFIAVSAGEGLSEIFAGLGADIVIEGGQTMNPSTEDMLNAIERIDADNIFILPNNSNIILASQQAGSLVEDKNVIVIPSKTIPQGIMALLNYMSNRSVEDNEKVMTDEMANVKSGSVTYSVRDTSINGIDIKQGDIMGISESQIMNVGAQVMSTTVELVENMLDDVSELVSLYYGADTTEDEANLIADAVRRKHPDVDVEVHYGGQPVYYYYLSVE